MKTDKYEFDKEEAKRILKEKGLKHQFLVVETGIGIHTINDILSGKVKNVGVNYATKIANALNVNCSVLTKKIEE